MKILSVYDSKAEAYLPPFTSQTNATAIRSFEGAVQQENSQFRMHATDYTLFCIGDFDEVLGIITPQAPHISLGLAAQFLNEEIA